MLSPETLNLLQSQILPTLGFVTTTAITASVIPQMKKLRAQKALGDTNPAPFFTGAANGVGAILYAYIMREPVMFMANLPGAMLNLWTAMLTIQYGARQALQNYLVIALTMLFLAGFVVTNILAPGEHDYMYVKFTLFALEQAKESLRMQQWVIGCTTVIFLLVFYASPALTVVRAVRERTGTLFSMPLAVACLCNASLWSGYGFLKGDIFIWGPNAFGIVLAIVQIIIMVMFWKNDKAKHTEMQERLERMASRRQSVIIDLNPGMSDSEKMTAARDKSTESARTLH